MVRDASGLLDERLFRGRHHHRCPPRLGRRADSLGPQPRAWINHRQGWHRFFEAANRYFGGTGWCLANRIRAIRLNLSRDHGPIRADESNPAVSKTLPLVDDCSGHRTERSGTPGGAHDHQSQDQNRGRMPQVVTEIEHGVLRLNQYGTATPQGTCAAPFEIRERAPTNPSRGLQRRWACRPPTRYWEPCPRRGHGRCRRPGRRS